MAYQRRRFIHRKSNALTYGDVLILAFFGLAILFAFWKYILAGIILIIVLSSIFIYVKSLRKNEILNQNNATITIEKTNTPIPVAQAPTEISYKPIPLYSGEPVGNIPQQKFQLIPEILQQMEWFSFELLCIKYFQFKGLRAEKTSAGADGGVDIMLYQSPEPQLAGIVQCKVRSKDKVAVNFVRELFGVKSSMNVKYCILMTNSSFTEDAIAFASRHGDSIKLISGLEFWKRITALDASKQKELEEYVGAMDYLTPTCPQCEIKMVRRRKSDHSEFWGCPNYNRRKNQCRHTFHI